MGIRASAPLAFHAADPAKADALWLWLPVVDGCAHVQSLEAQDLAARTDPHRYPLRALPVPAEREELVGFRTSAGFRRELASRCVVAGGTRLPVARSEEHTSELQSLIRLSYYVFCLTKQNYVSQLHY